MESHAKMHLKLQQEAETMLAKVTNETVRLLFLLFLFFYIFLYLFIIF